MQRLASSPFSYFNLLPVLWQLGEGGRAAAGAVAGAGAMAGAAAAAAEEAEAEVSDRNLSSSDRFPDPRHRNLKAFREHVQKHVSSCFVTEQYL